MQNLFRIGLTILAVIAGYTLMVSGLYVSQDVAFGEIIIGKTKIWQLVIAGLGAIFSAFAGGFVAGRLAPIKDRTPQVILTFGIFVETTAHYLEGSFINPLWFDMIAGLILIIGVFCGGHYYLSKRKKKLLQDIV